jgi:hypothetical protein
MLYDTTKLTVVDTKDDVTYWSYTGEVSVSKILEDGFVSDAKERGIKLDDVVIIGGVATNVQDFTGNGAVLRF